MPHIDARQWLRFAIGVAAIGTMTTAAPVVAQAPSTEPTTTTQTADLDDDGPDMGWLGLLGLVGLMGLRRRDRHEMGDATVGRPSTTR